MDLEGNSLTGTIPTELTQIAGLQSFKSGFNTLGGSVPDAMCFLVNLTTLVVDCAGNPPSVSCTCCTNCTESTAV
jgi:hypothetical protein